MNNKLIQGLTEIGIPQEQINTLATKMDLYIKELMLFNAAYDLVGAEDEEGIIVKHILDSLSAYSVIKELIEETSLKKTEKIHIGDIGSGGGFPGIPLAATFPEIQFTLIERMSKRCAFLENCAAILGLKNVSVENTQIEQFPENELDIATFRAFRPLDKKMTKTILRAIKPDGFFAAYKAKKESIEEEMKAISNIIPEYKIKPLTVPFLENHQRHIVLVKKN